MALSNSFDYTHTVTAADIIALALRRLGVYDPDETINPTEQTNALQVLNLIVKEWGNQGADIWLRDTMCLVLNTGSSTSGTIQGFYYATSVGSAAHLLFGFNAVSSLASAASASDGTITVTDSTGFATTDYIYIKLADNTIHATTINGAPSGNVITLANSLKGAASAGAKVYGTDVTNRFIGGTILQLQSAASCIISEDAVDNADSTNQAGLQYTATPISVVGSNEFHGHSNRVTQGAPLQVNHVRKHQYSEFNIWPIGLDPKVDFLELVVIYPIMDLDATTNNLYLTPDAFNALAWDLAAQMASEYGLSEAEQKRLWTVAESKKNDVFDFNVEDASVILEPARQ
jgi:hypothetical protein